MSLSSREQRMQTICLLVISFIVGAAALYWLQPVMIPFMIAVFIALVLTPLIELIVRYLRFPRPLAVIATVILIFIIFGIFGGMITVSIKGLADNSEQYQKQIENILDRVGSLPLLKEFGIDTGSTETDGTPDSVEYDQEAQPPKTLLSRIPMGIISTTLVNTTNVILQIFSKSLLVMIFVFFLLIGAKTRKKPLEGVWGQIEQRIKRFIVTKTVLSLLTGFLVGIVLKICGIQFALVFGFLAFLLNFIPSLGSIIATLLPLPVILMTKDISTTTQIIAIAIPGLVQFAIGNVIEPKIMGDSLDLHPVTLLMALIFWGIIWGIVGMLLAVPITAIIKILFERLEVTAPVAHLLAGRLDEFRKASVPNG